MAYLPRHRLSSVHRPVRCLEQSVAVSAAGNSTASEASNKPRPVIHLAKSHTAGRYNESSPEASAAIDDRKRSRIATGSRFC